MPPGVESRRVQQPPHQVRVTVVGAHRPGHGHAVRRPGDNLDRVARRGHPFLENPQVGPGPARRGEPLHPVPLAHPACERAARDAHRGDLDHRGAEPPGLAHQRPGHVQAGRGDVLAEHARWPVPGRAARSTSPGPPAHRRTRPGTGPRGAPCPSARRHRRRAARSSPGRRTAACRSRSARPGPPTRQAGRGLRSLRSPARSPPSHGIRRCGARRTGFPPCRVAGRSRARGARLSWDRSHSGGRRR